MTVKKEMQLKSTFSSSKYSSPKTSPNSNLSSGLHLITLDFRNAHSFNNSSRSGKILDFQLGAKQDYGGILGHCIFWMKNFNCFSKKYFCIDKCIQF